MEPFTEQDFKNACKELNIHEPEHVLLFATEDFWVEFDQACTDYVNELKQNKND